MDTQLMTLTGTAAKRINEIIAGEETAKYLRVSVTGGGCSGFQYTFSLDDKQAEDDEVIERDGARLLVDKMSLLYLSGSEVDFSEQLIGASFQIKNPNATASCGCGTSFSV